MILDLLCGESPLARRLDEAVQRHPALALAVLALAAILVTFADAVQGAL